MKNRSACPDWRQLCTVIPLFRLLHKDTSPPWVPETGLLQCPSTDRRAPRWTGRNSELATTRFPYCDTSYTNIGTYFFNFFTVKEEWERVRLVDST